MVDICWPAGWLCPPHGLTHVLLLLLPSLLL
jgi:hypothetical protein